MDKFIEQSKILSNRLSPQIPLFFIIGIGISVFNSLCRPDYNLFIYIYALYIWKFFKNTNKNAILQQKLILFYVLIYSLLIDILWCLIWSSKWSYLKNDPESGTHGLVIFFSWIAILLKICLTFTIGVNEWETIKPSLPKNVVEKFGNDYTPDMDDQIN